MAKDANKKTSGAKNFDASITYLIAGAFLFLALLPIYGFLVEWAWTAFNKDWFSSSIASYYEENYSEESGITAIVILQKIAIPAFAACSANKYWRSRYRKLKTFFIFYIIFSILLTYSYEFVLSADIYKERINMFDTSVHSLKSFFYLYRDPLLILLSTVAGLELFQKDEKKSGAAK